MKIGFSQVVDRARRAESRRSIQNGKKADVVLRGRGRTHLQLQHSEGTHVALYIEPVDYTHRTRMLRCVF